MRVFTDIHALSVADLQAMAKGCMHCMVSDSEFLETLSGHKCLLVPPWIVQAQPDGGLARVAALMYDGQGNLDKPRILLAMAQEFRRAEKRQARFGGRFR